MYGLEKFATVLMYCVDSSYPCKFGRDLQHSATSLLIEWLSMLLTRILIKNGVRLLSECY